MSSENSLKIQVIVDGSQVTAGMSNVTATIESAKARIEAAFGSVAKAPEGIQNALLVLQNSARMSAETVAAATQAIESLGASASGATPGVENLGNAAASTATQMSRIDNAMAMGTARMVGFGSGMGFAGAAMARVAASSQTLAPLLAAAFPALAAVALVDVLDTLLDKLEELAEQPYKVRIAFSEMTLGIDKALEVSQRQLDSLQAKFLDLTQGPLAAMRFELDHIALSFDGVEGAANRAFTGITNGLKQADMSRFNPVGWLAWLKGVDVGVKDLMPLADKINASLQEALVSNDPAKIQQALMSGITDLARIKQKTETDAYLAEADHNSVLTERYQQRMLAINSMIDALEKLRSIESDDQKKTGSEKADKRAAIAKELAKETEHASDEATAYDKAMEHAKLQMQGLTDQAKQLAEAEAEFGRQQDAKQSSQDVNDLEQRSSAERQFRQDRLNDARQEALAEIGISEEKVRQQQSLGKLSATQAAQQLNDLEAQKLKIETKYLQDRINTILARLTSDDATAYAEDLKEWSKLLSDKLKAEDAYNTVIQKNNDNAGKQMQKIWDGVSKGMMQSFDYAAQGITMGTERFGTAFAHMIDGMLAKFIEGMLQMLEQWTMTHVLMVAVSKSAQQEQVLLDAKKAASAAWSAVAGIPIIGPVLAPIAAATAFAGVEAFSASGGMDMVPADNTLALLHKRESVMPASIADPMRDFFSGGAGGGSLSIHMGDVHAIDPKGVQDVLTKQSAHLAKLVRRELRRSNTI
ncbi:MAG TPA: hypothetical protein VJN93_13640 [Candidatus Acidoferrum sp.]|nr:hypothetical protein [Candidatus Acidoferrum sp.]